MYQPWHICHYSAYVPLNNYLVFNDVDGLYTYSFEAERKVSAIKGLKGCFLDLYLCTLCVFLNLSIESIAP